MSNGLAIGLLGLILLLNILLAAAGSALRNIHPTHIRQMDEEGASDTSLARRVATPTSRLILTLRLGKSLLRLLGISVALAFITATQGADGSLRLLLAVLSVVVTWVAFGVLDFLAENFVLRDPMRWAVRLAPVVGAIERLMAPIVWGMVRLARRAGRSSTGRQYPMVSEEEIMTLVRAGEEGGVIEEEQKAMIYSIFQLDETLAREVMVPRIDVLAFEENTSLKEATEVLLQTGFSRAPVYSESIDNIIGLLYVKDLLAAWRKGIDGKVVADLARDAYFVPEAKKVDELLAEMQAKRIQMAVVVDEYGGTAGLVTFEDIVEEIVGEVRDEYDVGEELPYQQLKEGEFIFSGGIDLDDVNQLVDARLPKETTETLGGFIYSQLGRVPAPGEVIEAGRLQLIVEQVVGRRIRKVRAHRIERGEDSAEVAEDEHQRSAAE